MPFGQKFILLLSGLNLTLNKTCFHKKEKGTLKHSLKINLAVEDDSGHENYVDESVRYLYDTDKDGNDEILDSSW